VSILSPCEQFIPIGGDGYGFCREHECHVSTLTYNPKLKSLCDHCTIGTDGMHHVDSDVFLFEHDLVGLKSEQKILFDQRAIEGAAMKCTIPAVKVAPVPEVKKPRKPAKPVSGLF
jgi:hypothetical protein